MAHGSAALRLARWREEERYVDPDSGFRKIRYSKERVA